MSYFKSAYPDTNCLVKNLAGVEYEELACLYPTLKPFYTKWELGYDPVRIRDNMREAPLIPIFAVIMYAIFIVAGRRYMENKKPWNCRRMLALWNLSLSTFSFLGFVRTGSQLVHNLSSFTPREIMCFDPEAAFGSGATGLWVQLFILSKFPELLDTFFIVVHKKPLILLHWYHHITVLLYCWHSYVTSSPSGIIFTAMNYAVHSMMYGYYFLMAVKLKPKWMNAMLITVAQISQMFVGVCVTILGFYYYEKDGDCFIKRENNSGAFIMYGSYLALFLQFFLGRYFKKGSVSGAKKRS